MLKNHLPKAGSHTWSFYELHALLVLFPQIFSPASFSPCLFLPRYFTPGFFPRFFLPRFPPPAFFKPSSSQIGLLPRDLYTPSCFCLKLFPSNLGSQSLKLVALEHIYPPPDSSETSGGRILKANRLLSTNQVLHK